MKFFCQGIQSHNLNRLTHSMKTLAVVNINPGMSTNPEERLLSIHKAIYQLHCVIQNNTRRPGLMFKEDLKFNTYYNADYVTQTSFQLLPIDSHTKLSSVPENILFANC